MILTVYIVEGSAGCTVDAGRPRQSDNVGSTPTPARNLNKTREVIFMLKKKVKFYWWSSIKIWEVSGADIDDIVSKCHSMCVKYHANHFEVL